MAGVVPFSKSLAEWRYECPVFHGFEAIRARLRGNMLANADEMSH
jgi:hypothetical protein